MADTKPTIQTSLQSQIAKSTSRGDFTIDWDPILNVDEEIERLQSLGLQLDQALRLPHQPIEQRALDGIGPYVRLRQLGSGGCGTVYLAIDSTLQRPVAIKVPHPSLLLSESEQDRFLQEAKIVAVLKHPNIVEIYQAAGDDDCRYLVFEYCSGGSLAEWLAQQPSALCPQRCARIISSLARALDYAHQHGIVHRDVNPRNVLLSPHSGFHGEKADESFPFVPKLSDFGLGTWVDERRTAVRTQTGAVLGTLAYMAPEQTLAASASQLHLVDVYALGVMLYEMLTGVRPFAGATPIETLRMIREVNAVPPRRYNKLIPRDLETICLKCIEKSPASRYSSARLLAEDLELFQAGQPIRARRQGVVGRLIRWIAKRRLQVGLTLCITFCFAFFLIRYFGLAHELMTSRGNEAGLKQQSDARATQVAQAKRDHTYLNAKVQNQSEQVRRLSYVNEMQLVADVAPKRPFNAIQTLRKWIPGPGETDLRGFEWYYLMHVCGGDIVTFPPTNDGELSYSCLRVSPDERRVFVGDSPNSRNHAIVAWDIQSGKICESKINIEGGRLQEFVVSPNGQQIFASRYGDSIVEARTLTGPNELGRINITHAPFLACNRVVAHPVRNEVLALCASPGHLAPHPSLIWNSIETGRQLGSVTWPTGAVRDVVINPVDNSVIVAVDNSIEVYDQDRKKIQELKLGAHLSFRSLAVSTDGKQLAIATDQQQSLVCRKNVQGNWSLCGDAPSKRPAFMYEGGMQHPMFNSLGFDSTGDYLFSTHQWAMVVQAISSTGEPTEVARFSDLTIRQVQPLTTGLTAAWMSDKLCGLWQPSLPMSPLQGHRRETWSVAYSHSGKLLASGSDDLTAGLWDLKSGTRLAELKGHTATITAVEFSPDDSLLATASLDGAVKVWDVGTHRHLKTLQVSPTEVRALAWFSDGKRLATVDCPRNSPTNSILVWDVPSGKVLKTFRGFTDRVQSVLVTSDQQSVVGVSDDTSIRVFRLDGESQTHIPWRSWSTDDPIRCGVLLDQDRKVAIGDNNGMIRLRAVDTGVELNVLKGHTKCVLCLRLSPDGKVLASGGLDKVIHLWDAETGLRLLTLKDLPAQVNGLAFSPAGDVLTAALHDGSIKHFYAPRIKPIQFESR